jgi:hypothetical protein
MAHDPRGTAVAESYPTFWENDPPAPVALPVAGEDAYTAFVNLAEDEFPSGEWRLPGPVAPGAE